MRILTLVAIAAATAVPLSMAQKKPEGTAVMASEPGKVTAAQAVTASAKVEAVDKATRKVTLKMPKGDSRTVVAGDEVKNFDQIKVGDTVKVKYVEALTVELKKDGKQVVGRTESVAGARAPAGQAPGAAIGREVTMVGDVIALDAEKQLVTVKGERGQVDLPVRDPAQFKLVKKGDQIQVTYTEAVALTLEPAAPAPAPAAPKK